MKIKTIITILLALLIKFGNAQSWIYVTNDTEDAEIYVSSNHINTPYTLKVWVKTTEGKLMYDKNGEQVIPHGGTLSFIEFDCYNQKYKIHSLADLDSNGNVVDNLDLKGYHLSWYPIIPNSVYENVLMKVCELNGWQ
jgi:hypothetical protein